ncbi:hypothetical protein QQS21_009210 [Conoideocrella luteorostrata]|uniref:Allergen n=1 Tax=Conoideocrella luteorostrata TaxID=1105319 RepID=A0AAJ0CHM3_9HYPO|nr:hypothetical protein QQS21_009210 [Conoideocrella luteorostrata]
MEKAKQAVSNFLSQDGKHKTTVDEEIRKPVIDEHVHPEQHEQVVTAVDREIHQDHHQTIVQPIKDQETLPEKHTFNAIPVEHKSFEHGDKANVKEALQKDAAKYTNKSTTHDTTHTASAAPVVSGERTHHHVHHHVQPVVQKDTIQPEVVHTAVPVHETHHNAAIHHETTMLPAKTMDEYTTSRGELDANATPRKINEYMGCPTVKDKALRKDAREQQVLHGQ